MAVQINNYSGLAAAIGAWLARDGDADLVARADDFIALCETRIYYGAEALPALGIPIHPAVRVPEMTQSNASFALAQNAAQPAGMLELKEFTVNGGPEPLQIVEESILDSYVSANAAMPRMVAVSGTNFRFYPDPGTGLYTGLLRWYGMLATPASGVTSNWFLANVPGLYLNGCLLEAAIFTQDVDAAKLYASLYGSLAAGLNRRANRILASAHNVRVRVRGRTP